MILSAHQPCYLASLGLFAKMLRSSIFMHASHLQFQHGSWHNRNYIRTGHIIEGGKYSAAGKRHMLTIPIQRPHIKPIEDARFAGETWKRKHLQTIYQAYKDAPFFEHYYPKLQEIICFHPHSLARLNMRLTNFIADSLGITTPIVTSDCWHFSGDAIDMIIQMCKAVDADRYLSNIGARDYISGTEEERLEEAGIWHYWMDWKDPDEEPLSAIHHLMMLGPEAKRLIR